MASQDIRGLERVFKRMCHYAAKSKHLHAVEARSRRQAKLSAALKRPENKMIDKTGKPMTVVEVEEELTVVTTEIATYAANIRKIEAKGNKKISAKDIAELLKDLGNPMTKVNFALHIIASSYSNRVPSQFNEKNTNHATKRKQKQNDTVYNVVFLPCCCGLASSPCCFLLLFVYVSTRAPTGGDQGDDLGS